MEFKYLGHAGFQIDFGGKKLLFDPFITENPSSSIELDALDADYILLSHGHFDHVADVEKIVELTGAPIISSYEVVSWFEQKGCKGHGMNLGGKFKFDFGYVKYVNAVHSSQMPDGSYGGSAGGFVIWNDDNCFYFAGDTALTMDMKLIPMTCPKLDVAILPLGDYFTMGPDDALIAAKFIECDNIIACHHSTFEIINIDEQDVINTFKKGGKELTCLNVGEVFEVK